MEVDMPLCVTGLCSQLSAHCIVLVLRHIEHRRVDGLSALAGLRTLLKPMNVCFSQPVIKNSMAWESRQGLVDSYMNFLEIDVCVLKLEM